MSTPFSVALLMGGHSRRMGVDKASLIDPVTGLPSWQRQVNLLESLSPSERLLSLREGQAQPEETRADWQAVPDLVDDAGPLSGIAACLKASQRTRVLALGIDLLAMKPETLTPLLATGQGAVYRNAQGYFEPLAALYPKEASDSAYAFLTSGGRRLQDWLAEGVETGWMQAVPLPSTAEKDFLNVNTKEAYANLAGS